jgi:hypothetical protein
VALDRGVQGANVLGNFHLSSAEIFYRKDAKTLRRKEKIADLMTNSDSQKKSNSAQFSLRLSPFAPLR